MAAGAGLVASPACRESRHLLRFLTAQPGAVRAWTDFAARRPASSLFSIATRPAGDHRQRERSLLLQPGKVAMRIIRFRLLTLVVVGVIMSALSLSALWRVLSLTTEGRIERARDGLHRELERLAHVPRPRLARRWPRHLTTRSSACAAATGIATPHFPDRGKQVRTIPWRLPWERPQRRSWAWLACRSTGSAR